MIGFLLALAALIIGICLLVGIALGTLTPHLVAIAIICLALAILIGPAIGYINSRGA
jgi:uncharacterized protein YneF (UPF0154 family)